MFRLNARISAYVSSAALGSAVMALGVDCIGREYAGPPNAEGASVVEDDGDVVYVQDLPIADIEAYPHVSYGGVDVYYVEGRWYRRGARGWAYYREEPPELGRQRQEHWQRDHDQRWAGQLGAEHRGQEQRAAPPPAQRSGVTEAQPRERRDVPAQPPREDVPAPAAQAQPRRDGPAPAAPQALPRREEVPAQPPAKTAVPRPKETPPPPAPRRVPGRAPVHPSTPQPERR